MAGDPRWPLRQGILTKLTASSALAALVDTRIYDDVPEAPVFPFVVIDTQNLTEAGDKTNNVNEVITSIFAWSTYRGFKEVEQILSEVYNALHFVSWAGSPNEVTGYVVIETMFQASEEGRDPDGITRFGVSRFKFTLDPE